MSIRSKLSFLLACLFVASIGNAVFTFILEKSGDEKLAWVNHTNKVLNITEGFLSSMKDSETGQRGYLLTANISYLEPYIDGINKSKDRFNKLKELTLDNILQQKILDSIKVEMNLKFEELSKTIELFQNGNKNKALILVKENKGKKYMDDIRAQFNLFITNELILLEKRKGELAENRIQIRTLIFVEIIFFIGLAIITFMFMQRKFFLPIQLLLLCADKVKTGEELDVSDIVEKDEMGNLLSTFFFMSKSVYDRERSLDYTSKHDELTGLKNRISMFSEIEHAIHGLETSSEKLAILFLDLNSFKQVNDSLGHDIGDLVLKETADRINSSVRSNDTVFRIGGDEFLIIARAVKDVSDIQAVVANILKAFKTKAIIQGHSIDISISIGVAILPDDTNDSREVVKFADIAMYVAKRDKEANYKIFNKGMLRRSNDTL